jgi:hypothetical protein
MRIHDRKKTGANLVDTYLLEDQAGSIDIHQAT